MATFFDYGEAFPPLWRGWDWRLVCPSPESPSCSGFPPRTIGEMRVAYELARLIMRSAQSLAIAIAPWLKNDN